MALKTALVRENERTGKLDVLFAHDLADQLLADFPGPLNARTRKRIVAALAKAELSVQGRAGEIA